MVCGVVGRGRTCNRRLRRAVPSPFGHDDVGARPGSRTRSPPGWSPVPDQSGVTRVMGRSAGRARVRPGSGPVALVPTRCICSCQGAFVPTVERSELKRAREGSNPLPSVLETAAPPWLEPEWLEHAQDGCAREAKVCAGGERCEARALPAHDRFTGDGDPLSPRLVLVLEPQGGLARERAEARQGVPQEHQFGGAVACHRDVDSGHLGRRSQPKLRGSRSPEVHDRMRRSASQEREGRSFSGSRRSLKLRGSRSPEVHDRMTRSASHEREGRNLGGGVRGRGRRGCRRPR